MSTSSTSHDNSSSKNFDCPEFTLNVISSLSHDLCDSDQDTSIEHNPSLIKNVDKTLIKYIRNVQTESDLLGIGLCLRYRANPQQYVDIPSIGMIHILGYTYYVLNSLTGEYSSTIRNAIVIMLKIMGSNPNLPAIQSSHHESSKSQDDPSQDISAELNTEIMMNEMTVNEWLDHQKYSTILPAISNNYEQVDDNFMVRLYIFLDIPIPDKYHKIPVSLHDIIKYHSTKVMSTLDLTNRGKYVDDAITNLNLSAVEILLDHHVTISYDKINIILMAIARYITLDDGLSCVQMIEILTAILIRGIQLDQEQYTYLQSINSELADQLLTTHNQPYWISNDLSQSQIKLLAYLANINPHHSVDLIYQHLTKQATTNQMNRAILTMRTIQMNGKYMSPIQKNEQDLYSFTNHNQSISNGLDVATYHDTNGHVFYFTNDQFDQIRESKINPYTGQQISDKFMISLTSQRNAIRRLGMTTHPTRSFSEILTDASKTGMISNNSTDRVTSIFNVLSKLYGITSDDVNKLDQRQMTAIFRSVNNTTDVRLLSIHHARSTFYHIICSIIQETPKLGSTIFSNITILNS